MTKGLTCKRSVIDDTEQTNNTIDSLINGILWGSYFFVNLILGLSRLVRIRSGAKFVICC